MASRAEQCSREQCSAEKDCPLGRRRAALGRADLIVANHDLVLRWPSDYPRLEHVIVDVNESPPDFDLPEGMISLPRLMEAPEDDVDTKPELGDMSLLIYTSGTTGLPKATTFLYGRTFMGVALHAPNFIAHMMGRPGDILYTCLPLFHGNAL